MFGRCTRTNKHKMPTSIIFLACIKLLFDIWPVIQFTIYEEELALEEKPRPSEDVKNLFILKMFEGALFIVHSQIPARETSSLLSWKLLTSFRFRHVRLFVSALPYSLGFCPEKLSVILTIAEEEQHLCLYLQIIMFTAC